MINPFEETIDEIPEFDPDNIDLELTEKAKQIMDELKSELIYIEDYLNDYDGFISDIMTSMLHGFEHKEFRTYPVSFRFTHDKKEETKVLPFRMFLFNVIMWYPQVVLDRDALSEDHIVPESESAKVTPLYLKEYVDEFYVTRYRNKVSNHYLNEILSDWIYHLATLCHRFFKFMGLSMNIEVFRDLAKRFPEFDQLMNFKLDESKQPADMEKDARDAADRQWNIILNDPKFNILKPLLATNSLKKKQFAEFGNVIGLKPSVDGNTITTPINTNWIRGEINEIPITYINDVGGRKAAIINNEFMGSAGHLLILVATMCNEAKLSTKVEDCHSPNPTPIEIKTKKHLEKLDGRYYRFGGESKYRLLNAKKDTHLIGETAWFRSPATCCSEDGRICKVCYGHLSEINKDLYSIGVYAAFSVMMKVTQDLLSAKHMQETNSNKLEFPKEFYKCFDLSATDVIVNMDNDDVDEYTLVIKREDIHSTDGDNDVIVVNGRKRGRVSRETEEEDATSDQDEESFKLDYFTTKFYIVKDFGNKKTMDVYEIEESEKRELFIHSDFISKMRFLTVEPFGECFIINIEDINYDEFVFTLEVENNELSKPLKQIQKLIDNKGHEGCETYEEMIQKMLDLIIEAKNPGASVQGEIIIRELLRDSKMIMERPNFSDYVMPGDYKIMTINTALRKNPSITTSLSTPYLRYQLVSQMETFEKTKPSDMDAAFRETLEYIAYPVIKQY